MLLQWWNIRKPTEAQFWGTLLECFIFLLLYSTIHLLLYISEVIVLFISQNVFNSVSYYLATSTVQYYIVLLYSGS